MPNIFVQPFYESVPMYSISLALSKISLLLMYMRPFPGKRFNIACWTTIAVLLVCLVWACFGFMFMCTPIALWDKPLTGTLFGRIIYFTSAPFNIITDFAIFFLPLPILAKLQLPRRQKVALILLFGVGLVYVPFLMFYYDLILLFVADTVPEAARSAFFGFKHCIFFLYCMVMFVGVFSPY
jgi:hypothetical protein